MSWWPKLAEMTLTVRSAGDFAVPASAVLSAWDFFALFDGNFVERSTFGSWMSLFVCLFASLFGLCVAAVPLDAPLVLHASV